MFVVVQCFCVFIKIEFARLIQEFVSVVEDLIP